jgi:hypothetical protein
MQSKKANECQHSEFTTKFKIHILNPVKKVLNFKSDLAPSVPHIGNELLRLVAALYV